jgi:hypothetical protein
VIAESFERIHRSNLVGMGVLPLQSSARAGRRLYGMLWFPPTRSRRPRSPSEPRAAGDDRMQNRLLFFDLWWKGLEDDAARGCCRRRS